MLGEPSSSSSSIHERDELNEQLQIKLKEVIPYKRRYEEAKVTIESQTDLINRLKLKLSQYKSELNVSNESISQIQACLSLPNSNSEIIIQSIQELQQKINSIHPILKQLDIDESQVQDPIEAIISSVSLLQKQLIASNAKCELLEATISTDQGKIAQLTQELFDSNQLNESYSAILVKESISNPDELQKKLDDLHSIEETSKADQKVIQNLINKSGAADKNKFFATANKIFTSMRDNYIDNLPQFIDDKFAFDDEFSNVKSLAGVNSIEELEDYVNQTEKLKRELTKVLESNSFVEAAKKDSNVIKQLIFIFHSTKDSLVSTAKQVEMRSQELCSASGLDIDSLLHFIQECDSIAQNAKIDFSHLPQFIQSQLDFTKQAEEIAKTSNHEEIIHSLSVSQNLIEVVETTSMDELEIIIKEMMKLQSELFSIAGNESKLKIIVHSFPQLCEYFSIDPNLENSQFLLLKAIHQMGENEQNFNSVLEQNGIQSLEELEQNLTESKELSLEIDQQNADLEEIYNQTKCSTPDEVVNYIVQLEQGHESAKKDLEELKQEKEMLDSKFKEILDQSKCQSHEEVISKLQNAQFLTDKITSGEQVLATKEAMDELLESKQSLQEIVMEAQTDVNGVIEALRVGKQLATDIQVIYSIFDVDNQEALINIIDKHTKEEEEEEESDRSEEEDYEHVSAEEDEFVEQPDNAQEIITKIEQLLQVDDPNELVDVITTNALDAHAKDAILEQISLIHGNCEQSRLVESVRQDSETLSSLMTIAGVQDHQSLKDKIQLYDYNQKLVGQIIDYTNLSSFDQIVDTVAQIENVDFHEVPKLVHYGIVYRNEDQIKNSKLNELCKELGVPLNELDVQQIAEHVRSAQEIAEELKQQNIVQAVKELDGYQESLSRFIDDLCQIVDVKSSTELLEEIQRLKSESDSGDNLSLDERTLCHILGIDCNSGPDGITDAVINLQVKYDEAIVQLENEHTDLAQALGPSAGTDFDKCLEYVRKISRNNQGLSYLLGTENVAEYTKKMFYVVGPLDERERKLERIGVDKSLNDDELINMISAKQKEMKILEKEKKMCEEELARRDNVDEQLVNAKEQIKSLEAKRAQLINELAERKTAASIEAVFQRRRQERKEEAMMKEKRLEEEFCQAVSKSKAAKTEKSAAAQGGQQHMYINLGYTSPRDLDDTLFQNTPCVESFNKPTLSDIRRKERQICDLKMNKI